MPPMANQPLGETQETRAIHRTHDLTVRNLKPVPGKRVTYLDKAIKGFGVRITENGVRTYVLTYGEDRKRVKLGDVGIKGQADTADVKDEIQAVLRDIVILRDGGCILRDEMLQARYGLPGCSGTRKDGTLVHQADHLESRGYSTTYADSRLVVCVCKRGGRENLDSRLSGVSA